MAYKFALLKEVKDRDKKCKEILHALQKEVKEYFTFDIRLVGSGHQKLVTQNGEEPFDLDYNIILQRDKKGLLENPKQIKDIFRTKFDAILKEYVSNYKLRASDSTSVITAKLVGEDGLEFLFDVAIFVKRENGYFDILKNDKKTGEYIWNQVENSENYFERLKAVKDRGDWVAFKKKYLKLKNKHLSLQNKRKSFSVLLEALNEVEQCIKVNENKNFI